MEVESPWGWRSRPYGAAQRGSARNWSRRFGQHLGRVSVKAEARDMPLKAVKLGMIIMQDVRTHLGTLLVPRGFEVTSAVAISGPIFWTK
jgi:hypothetical protein